jgi:prolyl-tRNA synthetase
MEKEGEAEQDLRKRKKQFLPRAEAIGGMTALMEVLQKELLERARAMREKKTRVIDTIEDFEAFFKGDGSGFAWVHWAGTHADEDTMAKRFETSVRCIPFEEQIPEAARGAGTCILTGRPSAQRVLMAKAY